MERASYVYHTYADMNFEVIFRCESIQRVLHKRRYHTGLELLFVTHGHILSETTDETPHKSHSTDLLIFNPNEPHMIYSDDESAEFCCINIGEKFLRGCGFLPEDIALEHYINDTVITEKFYALIDEHEQKRPHYLIDMRAQIVSILVYLVRNYTARELLITTDVHMGKTQMVNHALQYLQLNFKNDITLESMAEELKYNKYYLCHSFKELTQVSIHTYLHRLRCLQARKLLLSGKYTISEIYRAVGFNSAAYFSKIYKRHMGSPPSEVIPLSKQDDDLGTHVDNSVKLHSLSE